MRKKLELCILCSTEIEQAFTLRIVPGENTYFGKCDKCHKKRAVTPFYCEVKRNGK